MIINCFNNQFSIKKPIWNHPRPLLSHLDPVGWICWTHVDPTRSPCLVCKAPNWCTSTKPLCPIRLRPLRESIDNAKDLFRVDFANESVELSAVSIVCIFNISFILFRICYIVWCCVATFLIINGSNRVINGINRLIHGTNWLLIAFSCH